MVRFDFLPIVDHFSEHFQSVVTILLSRLVKTSCVEGVENSHAVEVLLSEVFLGNLDVTLANLADLNRPLR